MLYGDRWWLYMAWWHWVIYRIVESIPCTSETNITLYINYTSIIKENKNRWARRAMSFESSLRTAKGNFHRAPRIGWEAHSSQKKEEHWTQYVRFLGLCYQQYHRLGVLNERNVISLQFSRPEVWDWGVSKVGFFWGLSPQLVDGHMLPGPSQSLPPCVQLCPNFLFL